MAEEEWLECLPWDGEAKSLPSGGESLVPGLTPEKLVRRWIVIDAESDEGVREVTKGKLAKDDIIIGAKMNEATISALLSQYGLRFMLIHDAAGHSYTRAEWRDKHGTDGLALWAIRNRRFGAPEPFRVGGQ